MRRDQCDSHQDQDQGFGETYQLTQRDTTIAGAASDVGLVLTPGATGFLPPTRDQR